MATRKESWQAVAERKRAQRAVAIASVAGSPDAAASIDALSRNADVQEITQAIAKGIVTAQDIVLNYIHRAAEVHAKTNCLTEVAFADAVNQAKSLDDAFRTTGKLVGPLHGVPMTVKDQFNLAGYDTTLGYVGRSFKPAAKDAVLVSILKSFGAVIIAKTNLPQSILWNETDNPLFGLTTHPLGSQLTPGGSSGGEAAILGSHASVCGWGTDIGGSIRAPAHLCGVFGLKPTSGRLPYSGVPVSHDGQSHVPSVIGPMAPRLSTLTTTTKAVIDSRPWLLDPNVTPLPWREHEFLEIQSRPLVIGLVEDDGCVRPHPELQLAVQQAAALFTQAGHKVVPWSTSQHQSIIDIMDQFYTADGGEDIRTEVEVAGEPMIQRAADLCGTPAISVYRYWQLNKQKVAAQEAYNEQWNQCPVDFIIMPVSAHAAVPHKSSRWVGYTKIWNLLDYTALSFPFTTTADKSFQDPSFEAVRREYCEDYKSRNVIDEWNRSKYDPSITKGLPIGIQFIGRRFEEEKILGAAAILETLLASQKE